MVTMKQRRDRARTTGAWVGNPRNTAKWRRISKRIIAKHGYLCVRCKEMGIMSEAVHTDHIVPTKDGGKLYHESNLQPLCKSCHSVKTGEDKRGEKPLKPGCHLGHPIEYCLEHGLCECIHNE